MPSPSLSHSLFIAHAPVLCSVKTHMCFHFQSDSDKVSFAASRLSLVSPFALVAILPPGLNLARHVSPLDRRTENRTVANGVYRPRPSLADATARWRLIIAVRPSHPQKLLCSRGLARQGKPSSRHPLPFQTPLSARLSPLFSLARDRCKGLGGLLALGGLFNSRLA